MKKNPTPILDIHWLRVQIPEERASLFLRGSLLKTSNGFKKNAELSASFTRKTTTGELSRAFLKRQYDFREVEFDGARMSGIRTGNILLGPSRWSGEIKSTEASMAWDLKAEKLNPSSATNSDLFSILGTQHRHLIGHPYQSEVLSPHLLLSGTVQVNETTYRLNNAHAISGRSFGTKELTPSYSLSCRSLNIDQKSTDSFVFLQSFKFKLGGLLPIKSMISGYIRYDGQTYQLNRLWDLLRSRSHLESNRSEFQLDAGPIAFKIQVDSKIKDFSGYRYENTDGNLLYCSDTESADLNVLVYRKGKLEATLRSNGQASVEMISTQKNPYVTWVS